MNQVIIAIDGTMATKVIAIALHNSVATEALRSALAVARCATYKNNNNLCPKSSKVSTEAAMPQTHDIGVGSIVGSCRQCHGQSEAVTLT
jgi:hypothetical protein